jgi:DNA-directed RNA polymerase specialized sigma54-like protein
MSRRQRNKSSPFNFIPIVHDAIHLLAKCDSTQKDRMAQLTNQFMSKMEEARKVLENTPGLDMTEEEQIQKIADLEAAIHQKQALIAECTELFESWQARP